MDVKEIQYSIDNYECPGNGKLVMKSVERTDQKGAIIPNPLDTAMIDWFLALLPFSWIKR